MRSSRGEVGTIDYTDPARPAWSVGRSVALADLALTGLREESEKTLAGRTLQCPNCGAALEVKLATTQSIVCDQCKSVIDLTSEQQGNVGADLAHYAQGNGSEPQIPLGSVGTLALRRRQALPWQVVGYVERCEIPQSDDDEQSFWREYLLYHRTAGFAFLVDAQDGWSWAVPITGAPQAFGESVKHEGVLYRKLYDYVGKVTYVLGEFYWRLARDERTANSDYVGTGAASARRLNREETQGEGNREVVWSAGETLGADAVLGAFRLAPDAARRLAARRAADHLQGLAARQDLLLDVHRRARADALSLRQRRRRGRLQRDPQHLRRRVAGVPELPQQPEQRQRLSQRRRLVRRLFHRRRPQVRRRRDPLLHPGDMT